MRDFGVVAVVLEMPLVICEKFPSGAMSLRLPSAIDKESWPNILKIILGVIQD